MRRPFSFVGARQCGRQRSCESKEYFDQKAEAGGFAQKVGLAVRTNSKERAPRLGQGVVAPRKREPVRAKQQEMPGRFVQENQSTDQLRPGAISCCFALTGSRFRGATSLRLKRGVFASFPIHSDRHTDFLCKAEEGGQ